MARLAAIGWLRAPSSTSARFGRLDFALATAVALIGAVHVGLLVAWKSTLPAPDPDGLGTVAHYLLDGLGYRSNLSGQPSAYPAPASTTILAGVFGVFGDSPLTIRAYNGVVFVATIALTYYAARQIVGPWFAAASALLIATYAPLLGGTLMLRYEGVQGLFTVAGVALTLNLMRTPGIVRGGLSGAAWAGSLLVKPVVLFFPLLAAVWIWRGGSRQHRRAAVALLVAFFILTVPWGIRVLTTTHSTALGFLPLLIGAKYSEEASRDMHTVNAYVEEIQAELDPSADPVGFELGIAERYFREVLDDPLSYAGTIARAAARFWATPEAEWTTVIPETGLIRNFRDMWDFTGFRNVHYAALALTGLGALAAILGRRRGPVLVLSFLVFFMLVYAFTFNNSRYYLPVWPVAMVLAGLGMAQLWRILRAVPLAFRYLMTTFVLVLAIGVALGAPTGPDIVQDGTFESDVGDHWVAETWGSFPTPPQLLTLREDGITFLRASLDGQPLNSGQRVLQRMIVEPGKRHAVDLDYRYDRSIGLDGLAEVLVFDISDPDPNRSRQFLSRAKLQPASSRWEHARFHFQVPPESNRVALNIEVRWSSPAVDFTRIEVRRDPGWLGSLRPRGGFVGAYWLPRIAAAMLAAAIVAAGASRLVWARRIDPGSLAVGVTALALASVNLNYAWRMVWPYLIYA